MILSPLFTLYDFAHACQEYVSGKFTQNISFSLHSQTLQDTKISIKMIFLFLVVENWDKHL